MVKSVDAASEGGTSKELEVGRKRLRESCQEFESVLTGFLLKSMRESVAKAEEGERGREMFEGLMDQALAGEFGRSGGMGIGDALYGELAPLLERKTWAVKPEEGASRATPLDEDC